MASNGTKIITGESALTEMRNLGYNCDVLAKEHRVTEGIRRTVHFLDRCLFSTECEPGINRMVAYHERINKQLSTDENPVFTGIPEKDGNDHGADSMRYVSKAFAEHKIQSQSSGVTSSDIAKWDKIYSRTG